MARRAMWSARMALKSSTQGKAMRTHQVFVFATVVLCVQLRVERRKSQSAAAFAERVRLAIHHSP
eukprot:1753977-Pleurochrysis_carterae.AAC.1